MSGDVKAATSQSSAGDYLRESGPRRWKVARENGSADAEGGRGETVEKEREREGQAEDGT